MIGAGISGLRAAQVLTQRGVSVIVLEGNHYVGGRIKDVQFCGKTVEEGANWITGLHKNIIWEMA